MRVSRAGFLKICGALLAGRAVGHPWTVLADAFAAAAPRQSLSPFRLEHASAAHFRPHLYTTFSVESSAGARLPVVLAQVTERPTCQGIEQFSLVFHAAPGAPPLHGTNTFRHAVLGEFDLFIAPVGAASPHRTVHEACFSRLLSADACHTGGLCDA